MKVTTEPSINFPSTMLARFPEMSALLQLAVRILCCDTVFIFMVFRTIDRMLYIAVMWIVNDGK
uniref:Uncharacterized protein n=1 Tax=Anopheles christyi TaxID=43041 RepID=A0A182KIX0_9DIPT